MSDRIRVEKASFESVEQNTCGLVHLQRSQPQVFETTKIEGEDPAIFWFFRQRRRRDGDDDRLIGVVADYQTLLELGRQIVQALDPSPQDQILDEMKAVRKFLEHRD